VSRPLERGADDGERLGAELLVEPGDQRDDLRLRPLQIREHRSLVGDRPSLGRSRGGELCHQLHLLVAKPRQIGSFEGQLCLEVPNARRQIDVGLSHDLAGR
jgi:hypothetical protein